MPGALREGPYKSKEYCCMQIVGIWTYCLISLEFLAQ